MDLLGELRRRIEVLFHRQRFRADLEEEMRLHIDLRQKEQVERGLKDTEARSAAQRRFGNVTLLKEKSQSVWGWNWLESLAQDALYGVRAMLRSPGVTAIALLSLALGIGANTAIFSFIDAVMLRSLPVKESDRLVVLGTAEDSGISDEFARTDLYSYPVYRRIQKGNQVFSSTAAVFSMTNDVHGFVAGRSEQEPMKVQLVSGTYFQTLDVPALMGRIFTADDDRSEGNHPIAVISYGWWKRRLARDPGVLHEYLRIGPTVYSIVGVAPPEFFGTKVGEAPDLWIPLSMSQAVPPHWGGYNDDRSDSLYVFGRLKPGITLDQASTNINLVFQQIFRGFLGTSDNANRSNSEILQHKHVPLTPMDKGLSDLRRQSSEPLKVLMTVVSLVLLIACANIANLLLARSTARSRELAVRQALGAGRSRIVRQLLTESFMLALAGGFLGIAFASVGSRILLRLISTGSEILPLNVSINGTLLLYALAITICTALVFGTVPAFRATRPELNDALKDGRGGNAAQTKSMFAKALVITQIAFSLVLLVGAGLFLHSLVNLYRVDSGFNTHNVLLFTIDESSGGYPPDDRRLPILHQRVEERLRALPGLIAASYSTFTFSEGSWNNPVYVQGFDNDKSVNVKHNVVGKDYFATMGIPIISGRGFGPQDTATSPKVAVISEHMAQTLFPGGSPIGRHYGIGGQQNAGEFEVIGIAGDVKFNTLDEATETLDYYPYLQGAQYLKDLEVRYSGDVGTITLAMRNAIHSIDPNLPITSVETLDQRLADSVAGQRAVAQLCTFFGLLAVFLSSIGVYGLMSYLVSRRTNEIGVRIALGADLWDVRGMVMREITLMAVAGIAVGVPVTVGGGRIVTSMLYGLNGYDSLSLVGAVGLLLLVVLLAAYFPARRASRVDPAIALRCE